MMYQKRTLRELVTCCGTARRPAGRREAVGFSFQKKKPASHTLQINRSLCASIPTPFQCLPYRNSTPPLAPREAPKIRMWLNSGHSNPFPIPRESERGSSTLTHHNFQSLLPPTSWVAFRLNFAAEKSHLYNFSIAMYPFLLQTKTASTVGIIDKLRKL